MSGGGKGGSETSEVKIPQFVEDASKANLARANDISQIGYTPYFGPDVAAFNPMQQAAFGNTGQAASAFGMQGGGMTGMEGMPQAQDFNGMMGYSSAPIYQGAVDQLQQQRPGQYDAIMAQFLNPMTGAPSSNPMQQMAAQQAAPNPYQGDYNGGGGPSGGGGGGGGGFGGYSGIGDAFNGGGPGKSGDTFSGGGMFSGAANAVASPRGSDEGSSGMGGGK